MTDHEPEPELLGAEAAKTAADETVEAIEEAAATNDDPEVADKLDEAAVRAHTASGRIGWLRSLLSRRYRARR